MSAASATAARPWAWWLAAVAVCAVVVVAVGGWPAPAEAAGPGPCTPVVRVCADDVLKGLGGAIPGLDAAAEALSTVGGVLAEVEQSLLAAGVSWFIQGLVKSAEAIWDTPGGFVEMDTRPQVTTAAFLRPGGAYQTVASFSVVLLVVFVFLGVIQGLLSGEPGQALFRLVRDTPVAVLAILGFPWLVDQLLGLTDGLCAALLPPGHILRALADEHLFTSLSGLGVGLAQLLLAVLAFLATVLVFVELVVRNVLVRLVVALAPLSFAGIVWPAARPAARKVAELTVAAVLAKPAVYVALKVGLDLLDPVTPGADSPGGQWGSLLVGMAAVCLAAFAPWVVWRLLPTAEAFLVAQGLSRSPVRAGMQVLQTAYWIDMIRSRTGRSARGGPGAPGGSPGGGPARRPPGPPTGGGAGAGGSGGTATPSTGSPTAAGRTAAPRASGAAAGAAGAAAAATAAGRHGGSSTGDGRAGAPGAGATSAGGAAGARRPSDGWARRPRPDGGTSGTSGTGGTRGGR